MCFLPNPAWFLYSPTFVCVIPDDLQAFLSRFGKPLQVDPTAYVSTLARAFTAASSSRPVLECVRPPKEVAPMPNSEGVREREMLEKQLEEVSEEASRLQVGQIPGTKSNGTSLRRQSVVCVRDP